MRDAIPEARPPRPEAAEMAVEATPSEEGWRGLALPAAVGGLLRALWCALVPPGLTSDANIYHTGALQLAAGNGFAFESGDPNGYWPLGYSAFLAPFYALIGSHPAVAVVLNLVLGTGMIAILGVLAGRLFGSPHGRLTAWIVALYPGLILYTSVVASENLFLPVLAAIALCAVSARAVPWGLVGQGVLVGAAIAVRPTALALPLVTLAGARFAERPWLPSLARVALVVGLALTVATPVAIRNQEVFGTFSYASFNGGAVLWMGNHEGEHTTTLPDYTHGMDVVSRDQLMREKAVAFIKARPDVYLARCFSRTFTALKAESIPVVWNEPGIPERFGTGAVLPLKLLTALGWWFVLALALVGAAPSWRRSRLGALVLLAGVAVNAAPFVLIDSQDRYHLPLLPFLFPLAAVGLSFLVQRLRRTSTVTSG